MSPIGDREGWNGLKNGVDPPRRDYGSASETMITQLFQMSEKLRLVNLGQMPGTITDTRNFLINFSEVS
jgi:hypothetical protein